MLGNSLTQSNLPPESALADQLGRPLRSLRVSVTDRCNLRCNYCMPEENYVWLPRQELLTFEEITRLVEVFTSLGVTDVRLYRVGAELTKSGVQVLGGAFTR